MDAASYEEISASTADDSNASLHLFADHGQHGQSSNVSNVDNVDRFFEIYFSSTRFTVETVIAMTSAGVNAAVLATLVIALTTMTIHSSIVVVNGRYYTRNAGHRTDHSDHDV